MNGLILLTAALLTISPAYAGETAAVVVSGKALDHIVAALLVKPAASSTGDKELTEAEIKSMVDTALEKFEFEQLGRVSDRMLEAA